MDLLTDSQLRIINEFRERVRQSEKRLRETLDSKGLRDANPNHQPESNYNTIDSLKGSDFKSNTYDTLSNSYTGFQKSSLSPLEETLPQRLLKPVVFNGNTPSGNNNPLAGSPNGIESIMRLNESLKSDHRSPKLGTENLPPPRKDYDSFISNPPSAKLDARYHAYKSEKESQRDEQRDLPQRIDDSLLRTKFSSNQSFTRSPNHSYDVSPANNFSRVDFAKRAEDFKSPTLNTSAHHERSDPNYLYFIESGKNNRLAVPSIRLFEYDRKDDPPVRDVRERRSSHPVHPEEDYNARGSYKSQKHETRSPIRRSPMRGTGDHESFDLGARKHSGIVSPHNMSAEGLDTFGNRSVPKRDRRRSQGSKGNILAYEDYKMNETSPIEREGRRTFSHPDKKKSSTPTKSIKKTTGKNFRSGKSKERDESAKKKDTAKARREREEGLENEPRKICKELIRRMKLGTLDTNKFISIMEDHMFFSTRFLENLKTVIKK